MPTFRVVDAQGALANLRGLLRRSRDPAERLMLAKKIAQLEALLA